MAPRVKYDVNQLRVIELALFKELRVYETPHLVGGPTHALITKTLNDTRKHIVRLTTTTPKEVRHARSDAHP